MPLPVDSSEVIRVMLIALPGTGKTFAFKSAATDPRLGNILLLDIEGNTGTIKSKVQTIAWEDAIKKDYVPIKGKIHRIEIDQGWSQLTFLVRKLKENKAVLQWDTIIIDSLTAADNLCCRQVVKDSSKKSDYKGNGIAPVLSDYNIISNVFNDWIRDLKSLGIHLITTAHTKHEKNQEGKIAKYEEGLYPKLTGELKVSVPGTFTHVIYIERIDALRNRFYFQPRQDLNCLKDQWEDSQLGTDKEFTVSDPFFPWFLDSLDINLKDKEVITSGI